MNNSHIIQDEEKLISGIILSVAAYFLFTVHDAVIKILVTSFAVWQVMSIRSATILVCCGLIGGTRVFREAATSPIFKPMLLRSFMIMMAWLLYFTAARHLGLAELTTLYFAAPIIATILSIVLLGEQVPWARWVAVLVGFLGVFIACDPMTLGLSTPALLVLLAAVFWALSIVLLRKFAMRERTLVQLVLNNGFFLVMTSVGAYLTWRNPTIVELAFLISMGALGGLGQFALFESMKRAAVSVIASFEYTSLVWAFLLGYLIWNDIPSMNLLYGSALIFASGIMIILTARRKRNPSVRSDG